MKTISEEMNTLIERIAKTPEFWKINYYFRTMKKAPHGGVFNNKYPNIFLKYYPVPVELFFRPRAKFPAPLMDTIDHFSKMISDSNIDFEDLLQYCLCVDENNGRSPDDGNKVYIAMVGGILSSLCGDEIESMTTVFNAINRKKKFTDNFTIDRERLIFLFILTLMRYSVYRINDLKEIVSFEELTLPTDKYGMTDVTEAEFLRQGFRLNEKYYLYNIFLDTSIGSPIASVPKTIEIMQSIKPPVQILTRCDENVSVVFSRMINTATMDSQKWRGITLDFNRITEQLRNGRETIVHFDEKTQHKVLVYVKPGLNENGDEFYHLNVEQLWNPEIFSDNEDVIITNYIHGTYYPNTDLFEHIDYSVNQYSREVFEAKYCDAEKVTGVSINKYGNFHYKIWCIRGDNIKPETWSNLVCSTLDTPFRNIFMETIGGTYTVEEELCIN